MVESTGSVSIPSDASPKEDAKKSNPHHDKCHSVAPGPLGLTRDTWAKLIVWFIPIIFASGALFFSFQNMDVRVSENANGIKHVAEKQQIMHTEQTVQATKLDTIKEVQGELKERVGRVNEKLDDQKDDLSAIREKMNIPKKEGI